MENAFAIYVRPFLAFTLIVILKLTILTVLIIELLKKSLIISINLQLDW